MDKYFVESKRPEDNFFVGEAEEFDSLYSAMCWITGFAFNTRIWRVVHFFEENKFQEVLRLEFENNVWNLSINKLYLVEHNENFDGEKSQI